MNEPIEVDISNEIMFNGELVKVISTHWGKVSPMIMLGILEMIQSDIIANIKMARIKNGTPHGS